MEIPIVNASINLTQSCNLRCSYCFTEGKSNKIISLDIAKKSIDFLINNVKNAKLEDLTNNQRKIDISFWGGEPLLEWDLLKEIVLYAESIKPDDMIISFGGTTNGVLLTSDKFDFLDEHKILFMVSFDGTKESHDKYRVFENGNGSYDIVEGNLKEIIKRWPIYRVRMSLHPDGCKNFYNDIKHLIDIGVNNIYYSPVFEYEFTEEQWKIWETECFKVIDLLAEHQKNGREIRIEHFVSYAKESDKAIYPCGAGRGYIGIDTDGSLWPCHRFIKFNDIRPWQEKEMCFGHVEYGIIKPEIRDKFINFKTECSTNECYLGTPCHGGCYAISFELTGDIGRTTKAMCEYVKHQISVSNYYKDKCKVPIEVYDNTEKCTCYNMCYSEGTPEQLIEVNESSNMTCHCYNTNYSGSPNPSNTRPIRLANKVSPQDVLNELGVLCNRIESLEEKVLELIKIAKKN